MRKYTFLYFIFLTVVASSQKAQGDLHKIDSLQKCLQQENLADSSKIKIVYSLAYQYLNTDGEKTLMYADQTIALAEKLGKKKSKAEALSLQGVVYKNKGDYKTAIEKHLGSLKNKSDDDTLGKAISYNDIGILYKSLKNYPKALECYRASNKLLRQMNFSNGISLTYGNIGTVYSEMNNLDSALYYYNKGLEIAEKTKNKNALTTAYSNIGEIYGKKHEPSLALDYFKKSLVIDTENNDAYGMVISYTNVGNALKDLHQYNEALRNYSRAEKIGTANDAKPLLKDVYYSMAQCYKEIKDPGKAFDYLSKYTVLNDSIINIETSKQMAELDTKYQSAEKDKDIIKKDAEIKTQEAEASKSAIEKLGLFIGLILLAGLAFFIFRGYRVKQKANIEISAQKEIIEEKNLEIIDSIHYAKRIQKALLASDPLLKNNLPEHFILYKPKDIVSGDFYWAQKINDEFLLCTADCTGHGVPGAFMSLLGISYLNEITSVRGITKPAQVLEKLREEVIKNLNAEQSDDVFNAVNDGMDMVLCNFNFKEMKMDLACANNPLWLIRDKQLIEYKADKFPISRAYGELQNFTSQSIQLKKGDLIYTLTDGYADQFGGPSGKKFKYKTLQQLLLKIADLPLDQQQEQLDKTINDWRGRLVQVDDILIIGVRV